MHAYLYHTRHQPSILEATVLTFTSPHRLLRSPLILLTFVCPRVLTCKAPWCQNVCSYRIKDPQGKNPLLTEMKMGRVIRKTSYMPQNPCSSGKCLNCSPNINIKPYDLNIAQSKTESPACQTRPHSTCPSKGLIHLAHSKCLINNL